ELNAGHVVTDSAGYKFNATAGRFVVEQNPRAGKEIVAFARIDGDPVAVQFRHSIRASGIKSCVLGLGGFFGHAKHLTGGSLIKTDGGIHHANDLEPASRTESGEFSGEYWFAPRGRDV